MAEKLPAYATPDQIPLVVNNLTSDSTTDALSAAQGKALNSKTITQGIAVTTPPGFSKLNIYKCVSTILVIAQTNSLSVNNGDTVFSLPSGVTPVTTAIFPLFDYNTGKPIDGSLWAYASGGVKYFGSAISATSLQFTMEYLTT